MYFFKTCPVPRPAVLTTQRTVMRSGDNAVRSTGPTTRRSGLRLVPIPARIKATSSTCSSLASSSSRTKSFIVTVASVRAVALRFLSSLPLTMRTVMEPLIGRLSLVETSSITGSRRMGSPRISGSGCYATTATWSKGLTATARTIETRTALRVRRQRRNESIGDRPLRD